MRLLHMTFLFLGLSLGPWISSCSCGTKPEDAPPLEQEGSVAPADEVLDANTIGLLNAQIADREQRIRALELIIGQFKSQAASKLAGTQLDDLANNTSLGQGAVREQEQHKPSSGAEPKNSPTEAGPKNVPPETKPEAGKEKGLQTERIELAALREELEKLKEKHRILAQSEHDAQGKLKDSCRALSDAQEKLTHSECKDSQHEAQLDIATRRANELDALLKMQTSSHLSRLAQLEKEMSERKVLGKGTQAALLQNQQATIEKGKAELARLKTELKNRSSGDLNLLREQLDEARLIASRLSESVKRRDRSLLELNLQIVGLENDNAILKDEAKLIKERLKASLAYKSQWEENQQIIAEYEETIEELKYNLNEAHRKMRTISSTVKSEYETHIEELEAKNEHDQAEMEHAHAKKIKELEKKIALLRLPADQFIERQEHDTPDEREIAQSFLKSLEQAKRKNEKSVEVAVEWLKGKRALELIESVEDRKQKLQKEKLDQQSLASLGAQGFLSTAGEVGALGSH
jgi:hypothetical protein